MRNILDRRKNGRSGKPHFSAAIPAGAVCLAAAVVVYTFSMGEAFGSLLLCAFGALLILFGLLGLLSADARLGRAAVLIRRIMLVVFAVAALSFAVIEGFIISGSRTDADSDGADFLIVLGAGIRGETPSRALLSRLLETVYYCERNPEAKVIVTGGQGPEESITEALAMHRYLTSHGIDPGRIFMEQKARDTIQNIRYSKEIVDSLAAGKGLENPRITIISNDFHIFRAKYIAARMGITGVRAVSAKMPFFHLRATYYVREYFSMLKVFLVT